jgi:HSP20 family protein
MPGDIFDEMRRFQEEIDLLFDDFYHGRQPLMLRSRRGWSPAVDVYETEGSILVFAEIAGVRREDVKVSLLEDLLIIRGVRRDLFPREQGGSYHKMEIRFGPFERRVILPCPVETDPIELSFEDGLLKVSLSKKEISKHKTTVIEIT